MPVIKRTLAGTICTRDGSVRLWLYFRGRKVNTGLRNTRGGISLAESMLEKLWRDEMGMNGEARPGHRRMREAWEEFVAERGATRARGTIGIYQQAFRYVILDNEERLNPENVERQALAYLRSGRHSAQTKNIMLRQIRTWCSWCVRRGYLARHPIRAEQWPKVPPKPVRVFTPEETRALIQYFALPRPEFSRLLRFLAVTGFSAIGETLKLTWEDVLVDRIVLPSKDGSRSEFYPRNSALNALFAEMHGEKHGRIWPWYSASTSRLHRWLADALRECGIKQQGRSFHSIRKTRWSELASAGVPLSIAAKLMRNTIATAERHCITHSINELLQASEVTGQKMGK